MDSWRQSTQYGKISDESVGQIINRIMMMRWSEIDCTSHISISYIDGFGITKCSKNNLTMRIGIRSEKSWSGATISWRTDLISRDVCWFSCCVCFLLHFEILLDQESLRSLLIIIQHVCRRVRGMRALLEYTGLSSRKSSCICFHQSFTPILIVMYYLIISKII